MLIKKKEEIPLKHTLFTRIHHLKKIFNISQKNIKKKSSILTE